ncbi:MAG: putative CRISPR-associated protein [Thermostichus sp. DG_1_6_bins_120]
MVQPVLMVSSCGTSTLTFNVNEDLRKLLNTTANAKETDLNPQERQQVQAHIEGRRQMILAAPPHQVVKLSAELNGILTYFDHQLPGPPSEHILLATDTFQGQATAQIVLSWLQQQGVAGRVERITDMSVRTLDEFRLSMGALVEWGEQTLSSYQKQGFRVVFNLTGGFKSINGFLQAMGMFYADECVYIFQESSELLRIPRLPLKLDPDGVVGEHMQTFRRLAQGYNLAVTECAGIPETLLYEVEGQVTLSEWGRLVWERCHEIYYKKRVWDPVSAKVRLNPEFIREAENLGPDRLALVNRQLDRLGRCLESDQTYNPRSLHFHKVEGYEDWYECYAWSDLDARRIYGRFRDGVFEVERLGQHL